MAVGEARITLALQVLSPGCRGSEPALRFDSSAADQRLPMVLAGCQREGAWEENDFGACLAQLPEQVGEADVVADRAADFDAVGFVGDDLVARTVAVAFTVARAIGGDNVEQVHLAIARQFGAVGVEYHRGVEQLFASLLDNRAAVDVNLHLPSGFAKELVGLAAGFVGAWG